jgi:Phosphotransferase enzyme family
MVMLSILSETLNDFAEALSVKATPDHIPARKKEFELSIIPKSITNIMGTIISCRELRNARSNLVLAITTENGNYILKAARGVYRSLQLCREYNITSELSQQDLPFTTTQALAYERSQGYSFFLQTVVGDHTVTSENLTSPKFIVLAAQALAQIHRIKVETASPSEIHNSPLR